MPMGPAQPLHFSQEATLEEVDLMTPSFIPRLRIERGNIPFSSTQYGSCCHAPAGWEN